MSSQAVINFVRRKLHERKDLCEIGELLCDYCVYPEANYDDDRPVGNDNMTVLIVAILNGRTKEEWYSWIHDRVESNYGYATPTNFPPRHGRTWTRPKPPAPKDLEGGCTKDVPGSALPTTTTTTGTTMQST
jgi:protein phosphatase 2C family protein 2/3